MSTLSAIERGKAGSAVGSVFEVATLLGIDLFPHSDDTRLAQRLALAPGHVYPAAATGRDDF